MAFQTPTNQQTNADRCPWAPGPKVPGQSAFAAELEEEAILPLAFNLEEALQYIIEPNDVLEAQEELQALLVLLDRTQAQEARQALVTQIQMKRDLIYLFEEIAG